MNTGFVTPSRFNRIIDIPFALAQTELRSGKHVQVAQIPVELGQRLDVRLITLHMPRVLTPGVNPVYLNEFLGYVSVGVYFGQAISCPIAHAKLTEVGSCTVNPFAISRIITPGVYTVLVANNTSNIDVAAVVTGCAKLYL